MSSEQQNKNIKFRCPQCKGMGIVHMRDSESKAMLAVRCPRCGANISVLRGDNVKIEAQVIGQSASEVAKVVSHLLQNDKR